MRKKVVLKDPSQKRPRGPFIYNFFLDHSLPSKTFKLKVEALPASTNHQPTHQTSPFSLIFGLSFFLFWSLKKEPNEGNWDIPSLTYLYFKTKNFDPSFSSSGKYNLSELIFDIPPLLLPYIISILSLLTKYTAPNRLLHGRQISNKIYMYRFLNYSRCLNGTFPLSKEKFRNTYMIGDFKCLFKSWRRTAIKASIKWYDPRTPVEEYIFQK